MTNAIHLSALEYVRATGGSATLAHFHEDHEPVGAQIWDHLMTEGLVRIDSYGKIRLTAAGAEALSAGSIKAAARPSASTQTSNTDNSFDMANPLNPISPLSPLHTVYDSAPSRSVDQCSSSSHSSDNSSSSYSSDSCSSSDSGSSSDY